MTSPTLTCPNLLSLASACVWTEVNGRRKRNVDLLAPPLTPLWRHLQPRCRLVSGDIDFHLTFPQRQACCNEHICHLLSVFSDIYQLGLSGRLHASPFVNNWSWSVSHQGEQGWRTLELLAQGDSGTDRAYKHERQIYISTGEHTHINVWVTLAISTSPPHLPLLSLQQRK